MASSSITGRPRICLALACDGAYAMPLATTLRSCVDSNVDHWPLDVHVFVVDFPEEARRKVERSLPAEAATIQWIPVDLNAFPEFSSAAGWPKVTYARFLLARVLPETISRVLYLDADLLVLGDLWPLWTQELEGAVLGAVVDGLDQQLKSNSDRVAGVPAVKRYFNAGVLLMDLGRWRSERILDTALDYLHRVPNTRFGDQDALNVACDGRWESLDSRWNFQGHLHVRLADMSPEDRPAIVHFITNLKPWMPRALSRNSSFYDRFRSRTRFARTPSERLSDVLVANAMRLHYLLSRSTVWRTLWAFAKDQARRRDHVPTPGGQA
jgi:lipopolysaccharide biosynthesis glycosyltransferase